MDDHAIVMADATGTIQFWSKGAETLFGYGNAQAVGQRLDLIVPDRYRDMHWAGFRRAMESGVASSEGQPTEIPVRCENGQVIPFPGLFVLLRSPQRKVIGAMAIFHAPAGQERTGE